MAPIAPPGSSTSIVPTAFAQNIFSLTICLCDPKGYEINYYNICSMFVTKSNCVARFVLFFGQKATSTIHHDREDRIARKDEYMDNGHCDWPNFSVIVSLGFTDTQRNATKKLSHRMCEAQRSVCH